MLHGQPNQYCTLLRSFSLPSCFTVPHNTATTNNSTHPVASYITFCWWWFTHTCSHRHKQQKPSQCGTMVVDAMCTCAQRVTETWMLALRYHNPRSSYNCVEVTTTLRHYSFFVWVKTRLGKTGYSAPSNCTTIHVCHFNSCGYLTVMVNMGYILKYFSVFLTLTFEDNSQTTVNCLSKKSSFCEIFLH
jgi:hypothetical protein